MLLDQRKKETEFVKMLRLLHLMTFDPILKLSYEHLVIKHFLNVFQTYNYKHTKFGLKWNMFTYKNIKLFNRSTYFLIFELDDLWPNFWPSYANSDLASTPKALYTC